MKWWREVEENISLTTIKVSKYFEPVRNCLSMNGTEDRNVQRDEPYSKGGELTGGVGSQKIWIQQ